MHASIAVCVMMVGGWVGPDSDVSSLPLKDDLSNPTSIQDMEWNERAKSRPLPRVPTIDDRPQMGDDGRTPKGGYRPYLPNTQRGQIPMPPTPEGSASGQGGTSQTGNPQVAGIGQGSNGQAGYQPLVPKNDPYANGYTQGGSAVGSLGNSPMPVPHVSTTPSVSQYINTTQTSISQLDSRYGLSSPTSFGPAAGNKPFGDYQRPNGFSPWQLLNQTTNNGTLSPYTSYVRPTMDQQNFDMHVSEQINGVQTMRPYRAGTPGMEMNSGGNGLVNPNTFQDYRSYYPGQGPMNPYPYAR